MRFAEFQARARFESEEILAFSRGALLEDAPAGLPGLPGSWLLPFHEVREISWDAAAGTGRIVAARRNKLDDWYYDNHFRGDPVMPGCWGIDAVWQCLAFFAAWRGLKGCGKPMGMSDVSFFGQIRPWDQEVLYAVDVVSVETDGGETLVTGKASVSVDGGQVYSIGSAQVATAYWTEETPAPPPPRSASVPDEGARRLSWPELSAKTALSRAEVLGLAHGSLIEAPGREVGLLPSGAMLEIGRVEKLAWDDAAGEGELRAARDNAPGEWFFSMTPGVKPAVLAIDAVWQLCGLFLTWRGNEGIGRALGFERVEVYGEVLPSTQEIRYEARIVRHTRVPSGDAFVRADARVWADGKLLMTCANANVGCHKNIRYADYPLPSPMSRGGRLKIEAAT